MIQTTNLSKGYNSGNVIHDISINLSCGTIYGLIGSNGSGKTTMIRCLAGIYRPDTGTVLMDENEVYDNAEAKSEIAYIDDMPEYNPLYSVQKQANYYGAFYENFSYELFEKLALEFNLDVKSNAHNLSLGQKKKLSLALALARNPKYILLDEPENGLDNESRIEFRKLIREAADNGACILLSSHDLSNIEDLCDEIIFMDAGKIIFYDTIDRLFEQVNKWLVKSKNRNLSHTIVLEECDDVLTVVTWGQREEVKKQLEAEGASIISPEKTSLSDAYLILKKEVNYER
ncbi:MAG: ABC transporter ATP-binding protein [Lachnospiraceae bacterium]